jgi:hypothetical protein
VRVEKLSDNRRAEPVRVLGESLVLFRDQRARYGLLERVCPTEG